MNVIDVYDIATSTWYKQATSGSTPDIRVNPCAVVASAADGMKRSWKSCQTRSCSRYGFIPGNGEGIVAILGSPDPESTEMFAETVSLGDPTYAGALAGVSLKLPVFHVTEPEVRAAVDPAVYADQIEMMEMVLDIAAIHAAVRSVRGRAAGE